MADLLPSWADTVTVWYRLRGLTRHRFSPKEQIHSIKHWQAVSILLKLCEQTGERVRNADHMEIDLNKPLFEPFYFLPQPFFNTSHQVFLSHQKKNPILQISAIVPNNSTVTPTWCALQNEAKAGIINEAKVLRKSLSSHLWSSQHAPWGKEVISKPK